MSQESKHKQRSFSDEFKLDAVSVEFCNHSAGQVQSSRPSTGPGDRTFNSGSGDRDRTSPNTTQKALSMQCPAITVGCLALGLAVADDHVVIAGDWQMPSPADKLICSVVLR